MPRGDDECDVLVVGGGPAGIAAACAATAAAGGGGRVMLVEKWGRLGGTVSAGLHRCLCGLYAGEVHDPRQTLNAGIQRQIVEHLLRLSPATTQLRGMGRCSVLEFAATSWQACVDEMCRTIGVDVRLETSVTAAEREGRRMTRLCLNDRRWLVPRVAIDCTGQAKLLSLIGPDTLLADEPEHRQSLGGYSVQLTNITGDTEMLRVKVPLCLARHVDSGDLPTVARFTMFHPGPGSAEGVCKFAVMPDHESALTVESQIDAALVVLKRELPALAHVVEVTRSPGPLRRTGRRMLGRAVMTRGDIFGDKSQRGDGVLGWWPVERWDTRTGPTYEYPPSDRPYAIPVDAMRSAVLDNVFAAGQCISADADAAHSVRVAGICLATGDAAGQAAISLAANWINQ